MSNITTSTRLNVVGSTIRHEKEIKGRKTRTEEIKTVITWRHITVYSENPNESKNKVLALISEFSNVGGYNQYKITIFPSKIQRETNTF